MNVHKTIVFLFFFNGLILHINTFVMERKWCLLSPEIMMSIIQSLDFFDCYNLRQSCKAYRKIINQECRNAKIEYLKHSAETMDVETYTKYQTLFFSTPQKLFCLYSWTNDENRRESNAISYLLSAYYNRIEKSLGGLGPEFVYSQNYLKDLSIVLKKDFEPYEGRDSHVYSYFGGIHIIRLLLHRTGNINHQDEKGNTLLHYAKHPCQCRYLLQQPTIDVNISNNKGETSLHYAIAHPCREAYTCREDVYLKIYLQYQSEALLKDERTNIRAQTNKGKTILHYAAKYTPHITKLLVERLQKIDVCVTDNKGRNALYFAVKYGHLDAVKLLFPLFLEKTKFSVDQNGKTLLHVATHKKIGTENAKIIKYLLAQFPNEMKYVRDNYGKTFLDYVYEKDRWNCMPEHDDEYLISKEDMDRILHYNFLHSCIPFFYQPRKLMIVGSLMGLIATYFYIGKRN